jgi:hypothetical protein
MSAVWRSTELENRGYIRVPKGSRSAGLTQKPFAHGS